MSKKKEKPMQFLLSFGGGVVNQCYYVSEDELEEKTQADRSGELLEKALEGRLSERSLSRHREALLREALRRDRAEALAALMPQKRMEPERFAALFRFAEECRSPDALAWLLEYRGSRYDAAEFSALEERKLDLELGLAEPGERELRRLFRLRYERDGVFVCGAREARRSYEIPARIGEKPVIGVDAAAFYAVDPMPRLRRSFEPEEKLPSIGQAGPVERILFGRGMEQKGKRETALSWRVLRREENRALLLCERKAAVLPYHREPQEVTWESCDLRRWLNAVFLPLSFSEAERARILPVSLHTPDNPQFGSSGGADTEDRLFLLSLEESLALLPEDADRALDCWWWLRSPGFDNAFAASVTPDGSVSRLGSFVEGDDYAVRPALWLKTE